MRHLPSRAAPPGSHAASVDALPWRRSGSGYAGSAHHRRQCRRPGRTPPAGLLQRHAGFSVERRRALPGLCCTRADHEYCARTWRTPDRPRPDRGGRHRALDHRRHHQRRGSHRARPYPRETHPPRHLHQSRRQHRPAHLSHRVARRRGDLDAQRCMGLSRGAIHAPHPDNSPSGDPARGRAALSLWPAGRCPTLAAGLRLRRWTACLSRLPPASPRAKCPRSS